MKFEVFLKTLFWETLSSISFAPGAKKGDPLDMVDIAGDDMTKDMSKQEKRALAIAKLAKVLIPA